MSLDRMNPPLPAPGFSFCMCGGRVPSMPPGVAGPIPKASPMPQLGPHRLSQRVSLPMRPHVAFINLTARKCR